MIGDILLYGSITIAMLIVIAIVGMLMRLYRKATPDTAFVKSGWGGNKAVTSGGALVLPILHQINWVSRKTIKVEVAKLGEDSLTTQDRMKVQVKVTFYVRVSEDGVVTAASTLGGKTQDPQAIIEYARPKFEGALRAVALEMEMEELNENRIDFIQRVKTVATETLAKNGLELEEPSLTYFNLADKSSYNESDSLDAQGLVKLTQKTELHRKEKNAIEKDTQVEVERKNQEANKKTLDIKQQQEYDTLEQQREVTLAQNEQQAKLAEDKSEKTRREEAARISQEQSVELAQKEKEKALEIADIAKKKAEEEASINKRKAIEMAEMDRQIALAEKSKEESQKDEEAALAKAKAVEAEEKVQTAKEVEVAERKKRVALLNAEEEAEEKAIEIRIKAQAEKDAAENKAETIEREAKAEANATITKADAKEREYQVEAAGIENINKAKNALSTEQTEQELKLALINALPNIIANSVKPLEKIEGIKIIQVAGLDSLISKGNGNGNTNVNVAGLPEQIVQSALNYRVLGPMIDDLMREAGLGSADSISSLVENIKNAN
jgi:uncharacterized membrane protein YqiK